MTEVQLNTLQKALINCVDYVRLHLLYSGITNRREKIKDISLIYIHNNFIESAILKWAHIYGNHNDSLHYRRSMPNCDQFKIELLESIDLSDNDWKEYWSLMKNFRDKRVSHIDPEPLIEVPNLDIAYKSISFFYRKAISIIKDSSRADQFEAYYDDIDEYAAGSEERFSEKIEKIVSAL